MATREQKHAYSERSWDKRIKREDYQDEVFSYNKSRFGKRKERDAYNDSRFEKQKERDAYNDKSFAKKVRREKYSTAVSYFLVIVLVGGIFLSSGFLSDLETFIPTETKTTYKDTNVVKYEVASNWDNVAVLNVGKSAMNVFTQVGAFIANVGSFGESVLSLFQSVLGMNDNVILSGSILDYTSLGYTQYFSSERDFWLFYSALSSSHSLTYSKQPHVDSMGDIVDVYVVPLSTVNKYLSSPDKYLTFWVKTKAFFNDLFTDWNSYTFMPVDSDTLCPLFYVLTDDDYLSFVLGPSSEEET